MAEIHFYHLQRQPLEAVLPTLIEKSLGRGWRAVVQATSAERLAALDDHLWTFSDESFLAHATDKEPDAADQPVVLTLAQSNPNRAAIRFLVEGAPLPAEVSGVSVHSVAGSFHGGLNRAAGFVTDPWLTVHHP